jgi:chemosensory pili system protein ChpA (sensor histidine kinase/response regulator)
MENRNTQNFIEEAESFLPLIRSGILVCSQEGNFGGELANSLRYARAIKNSAYLVGLSDIGRLAGALDEELSFTADTRRFLSYEQTRSLLDQLAQIEALLAKLHFSNDDFPANLDGFVDQSFENLWIAQPEEASVPAAPASAPETENELEGFEIDHEMLEIFGMEAEELLQSIGAQLSILEAAPNDRAALLEIRRNAHTLKGSAGIVGLKPLAGLAHRVEDLLDFLSENEIAGSRPIVELLLHSTDCLGALASGDDSPQLDDRIAMLYQNFESALSALQAEKEKIGKGERGKNELRQNMPAAGGGPRPVEENQAQKSVVRVSLEKLDELGRLVSDLIITRSVFEQRLAEFERQIGELHLSTERLKRSTGKIETDFEANALSLPAGKFQMPTPGFIAPTPASFEFDALEFDRYTEFHQTTRELLEATGDASSINAELDNLRGNLELLFDNQYRLIEEMQDKLLRLRMVQFGTITPRLQRPLQVTCEEENKRAELVLEGEETEVDTQILHSLAEPLLHLLRNAVAHGIEAPDTRRLLGKPEKGRILLRVRSEGTHIILSVSDDGRGISAAALKAKAVEHNFVSAEEAARMTETEAFSLGFLPGLTTAETVRQTAGRGVGMNIIKTSIARQHGTISIASEPQKGATFTVRLPMALAVTRGLLVRTNGQTFAFPLKLVRQVTEIPAQALETSPDKSALTIDGVEYTLSRLETLLGLPPVENKKENVSLLLLETSETQCILVIEEIIKAEEMVIKPLGEPLRSFPYLLGATILGDGRVIPVLDLMYLIKNKVRSRELPIENEELKIESGNPGFAGRPAAEVTKTAAVPLIAPDPQLVVMIVDDSPSVRHITSKLVKNAGFEVVLAKDGLEALELLHGGENLPGIVLTDVEMPRMGGYELLAAVKNDAALAAIPVVMITSRASEKHRQKAVELGVSEFLNKPFDDAVLIETIKSLSLQGTKL